jgi:hypothetical protein
MINPYPRTPSLLRISRFRAASSSLSVVYYFVSLTICRLTDNQDLLYASDAFTQGKNGNAGIEDNDFDFVRVELRGYR